VPRSKTLWQLYKRELEMSLGDRGEGGDGRREGRGPHSDDREARGPDPRVKHLDAAGGGQMPIGTRRWGAGCESVVARDEQRYHGDKGHTRPGKRSFGGGSPGTPCFWNPPPGCSAQKADTQFVRLIQGFKDSRMRNS